MLIAALLCVEGVHGVELSAAARKEIVGSVIAHLESDYVDPEAGGRAAQELRQEMRKGAFEALQGGAAFAAAITSTLRAATGDGHLNVEYSERALEDEGASADATFTAQEMERYYGAHVNFGVKKAERLDGNIGLLEMTVFPPAAMGGATVAAAMQVIAHTDVLIIDLRHNGGGSDTVSLVASYLFDEPKPLSGMYDRPAGTTMQSYTQPYVPGAKFGERKPVYVLISKRTFSAAEALAYDLQALKRATIIGEPSGGGAHPFTYKRIHPHFVLWSVTQKSVNPITNTNWQGVGVQPDVRVEATRALEKAIELLSERRK
jgi:C-terminal processing protease CtpA/Prc